jgi:hypothetical protein
MNIMMAEKMAKKTYSNAIEYTKLFSKTLETKK